MKTIEMKRAATLIVLAIVAISGCGTRLQKADASRTTTPESTLVAQIQQLEKRVKTMEDAQGRSRTAKLRLRFEARVANDRKNYTQEERREIEALYQDKTAAWGSAERREELTRLIEEYPEANRAGCAMLYLGQMAEGQEQETCFRRAMEEFDDCWYGDGVQVGAYARFYLARYYQGIGNTVEAEKLHDDIRKNYSTAVNHKGDLLTELIPQSGESR